MRGAIGQLDSWGYGDAADEIRRLSAELQTAQDAFRDGTISGDDFAAKLAEIEASAQDAFASLSDVDRAHFSNVISQLSSLGGVIASVTSLASGLVGELAKVAGVDGGSKRAAAADRKMAAEQASLDALEAQTEANENFTASEAARNSATAEGLRLEREREAVRKRAQEMGARLTEDQITSFAESSLAGDAARSATGRGGGGAKGTSGGGVREKLDDFSREAQSIRERTEALMIEAQVYAEVAASGQAYGDVMAYAQEKASLLTAAQQAGKQVTPDLIAQIDQLALSYATAGMSAEEAAARMEQIQSASQRGRDALENMFGSIIDGSMSAKDAVLQLIAQIARVQLMKGLMGLPGIGGAASIIGNLLSFDGGGYTGNGARSGGLDGKGGFITLMHPRETVIDHTKGQTVPGGGQQSVHVTVGVDPDSGNLTAFVDRRAGSIAQRTSGRMIAAYDGAMPQRVQGITAKPWKR